MRSKALHTLVTDLVQDAFDGDDQDVAEAVLADDAFGALCYRLNEAGDGSADDVTAAFNELVTALDDETLDFLAEQADAPAAFLASRV